MKLIQVLQAYPARRLYLRGDISGILRLFERKDPSTRISRKLETLVGKPELSTLRRTVVQYGHWYIAIRPDDRYTYLRSLCDFTERKNRIRCVVYAVLSVLGLIAHQTETITEKTVSYNYYKLTTIKLN